MPGGLHLAGDGRCDCPGHSAKYGGYNDIEQRINKIADIKLIQSSEVANSNACELEGLKRSMSFLLDDQELQLDSIITDRHKSINKYIRDDLTNNHPNAAGVQHYFDIWHVAKGLGKKIDALGKKKDCEDIVLWKKSIINHVYYVAGHSVPDGVPRADMIEAMWTSLLNHIRNLHVHVSPIYPQCEHPPLVGAERQKQWLELDSKASDLLEDVILSKALIKDLVKMSPLYQTSTLEAFHSLIIKFAPKHTGFMWLCQYARYCLAALHFNHNSGRLQAVTRNGRPRFSLRFPKFKKGEYTIRKDKTPSTYGYVEGMMQSLLEQYSASPTLLKNSIAELRANEPGTLAEMYDYPDKDKAERQHMERFLL